MKIKYYGHACFSFTFADGTVVVTDPYDGSITYPPCDAQCDAAILSHDHFDHNHTDTLRGGFTVIRTAGQQTVGGVKITSIPSFHDPEQGALRGNNLLSVIEGDGLRIAHLGDLGHMPNDEQRAFLQDLDLLCIPAGGFYTIDSKEAQAIIADVKPRHTIAMHFSTEAYMGAMATDEAFVADTGASRMPNEIEYSADLPAVMVMNYK